MLRAGIVPSELVFQNPYFRPEMVNVKVPYDTYVHIAGIDIVRIDADDFYVLEDNARTPSGVSYMLENREVMMRLFPELFAAHKVAPVENYADLLLSSLRSVAPRTSDADPVVALLTPGQYNSAYYETFVSWRTSWASSSSRAAICSSTATSSTCAPPKGRSAST